MGQHYTLTTIEVSEWCNKCRKNTPHRVANRRLQYCLTCYEASKAESETKKSEPKPAEQGSLFGGGE
jgi:hypothetical protein